MKSKKTNAGESFQRKVFSSLLYSLLLTLTVEYFAARNLLAVADYEVQSGSHAALFRPIADFRLLTLLLLLGGGILFFCLVFWFLQRKSFAYIGALSAAMRNMAEGDLRAVVHIEGDDEFSEMGANLNRLGEELQALMEREREAEKSKSELVTNIAHDLRTPLTSIVGYLDILRTKRDGLDAETAVHYTEIAYEKSKKLEKLINELFGFTKLSGGELVMHVRTLDLVQLLAQLLEEFYPSFSKAGLHYELIADRESLSLEGDPELLARVFENLIGNAIKYGAEGKQLRVFLNTAEQFVTVRVVNYGKVIPAEELPHVFDRFYRVEQSRNTKTGGTGLGLTIAKNIVEMHRGEISVTSDLTGTAFIVRLPRTLDFTRENFANAYH
ncbi:HAMP domain-containing sensor histidine kinase [Stomatobaculum longum]|uniref:sensor histidine kinase n=1 Tax=Stomatobaculum longum TaxID=796942 RepID=UPI0028057102|nr:HAMP domain-containing sensor histidine kinase [Stomatobaculum longum]